MSSAKTGHGGSRDSANPRQNKHIECIRLWKLPSDFFSLPTTDQFAAIKTVTIPAVPLAQHRVPSRISTLDDAVAVCFFIVTLGLPFALAGVGVCLGWTGDARGLILLGILSVVLALHPIPSGNELRHSRLALALVRYFSMEIIVDRSDPMFRDVGTPAVDEAKYQSDHLPAVYLACPHGVFNYGAIIWCCVSRWLVGWEQYTGVASLVRYVPGLRYMGALIWPINASRKSIEETLRQRGPGRKGGMLGMVPDGILGAFRTRGGVDELLIGSRRGLLRICAQEGATVYAAWFFGTNEMLTVLQDPLGIMERLSRRLQAGIMGFYGRWFLPVPRRVPVTVVVAPHSCEKIENPTVKELENLHSQVYGGLERVFDNQKVFAGYPNRRLIVK